MVAGSNRAVVRVERTADGLGVSLAGVLDETVGIPLFELLRRSVDGERAILLDLSGVSNANPGGVDALLRFRDRAAWLGIEVVVFRAPSAVVQLLAALGHSENLGPVS